MYTDRSREGAWRKRVRVYGRNRHLQVSYVLYYNLWTHLMARTFPRARSCLPLISSDPGGVQYYLRYNNVPGVYVYGTYA